MDFKASRGALKSTKAVPGKLHGSCRHRKHNCLQDRVNVVTETVCAIMTMQQKQNSIIVKSLVNDGFICMVIIIKIRFLTIKMLFLCFCQFTMKCVFGNWKYSNYSSYNNDTTNGGKVITPGTWERSMISSIHEIPTVSLGKIFETNLSEWYYELSL